MDLNDKYLNNHFSLKFFLKEYCLDYTIIDFCKQNNLDINYIGFVKIIDTLAPYPSIITTSVTQLPYNGYRLMTITKNNSDDEIIDYKRYGLLGFIEIDVTYNNLNIKISKQYNDYAHILNTLNKNIKCVYNKISHSNPVTLIKDVDCSKLYDKNTIIPQDCNVINYENDAFLYDVKCAKITCNNRVVNGIKFPKQCISILLPHHLQWILPKNTLPCGLIELEFGFAYNLPLTNILPKSLKKLTLGTRFNNVIRIGDLPDLEELIFGAYFDKYIEEGVLPMTLKKLTYGKYYRQPICKLPNLLELCFSHNYNKMINVDLLPNTLQKLKAPIKCFYNGKSDIYENTRFQSCRVIFFT